MKHAAQNSSNSSSSSFCRRMAVGLVFSTMMFLIILFILRDSSLAPLRKVSSVLSSSASFSSSLQIDLKRQQHMLTLSAGLSPLRLPDLDPKYYRHPHPTPALQCEIEAATERKESPPLRVLVPPCSSHYVSATSVLTDSASSICSGGAGGSAADVVGTFFGSQSQVENANRFFKNVAIEQTSSSSSSSSSPLKNGNATVVGASFSCVADAFRRSLVNTLRHGGRGPVCVGAALHELKTSFEQQQQHHQKNKRKQSSQHPVVASAADVSNNNRSCRSRRELRVVVSFALNGASTRTLYDEDGRLVLLHRYLRTAMPLLDELHIVVDSDASANLTRKMVKTMRMIFYRMRKDGAEPMLSGSSAELDRYVANVRVLTTSGWKISPRRNDLAAASLRVYLLGFYLEKFLPSLLQRENRSAGLILVVDVRDVLFQANVHNALQKILNHDEQDFVFAVEESMLLNESSINQAWLAGFIGRGGLSDIFARDNNSTRVLNSGIIGGTHSALKTFCRIFRATLDCGLNRVGEDQPAFFVASRIILPALAQVVHFPFVLLNPDFGPIRHWIPPLIFGKWPRGKSNSNLLNCRRHEYALIHQADRQWGWHAREVLAAKKFVMDSVSP